MYVACSYISDCEHDILIFTAFYCHEIHFHFVKYEELKIFKRRALVFCRICVVITFSFIFDSFLILFMVAVNLKNKHAKLEIKLRKSTLFMLDFAN